MELGDIDSCFNNDDNVPEPTKCESGKIQAINKNTVHQICSGQVVLSLAVAVKELVENSIDAGATLVEVKLREQGLESVEVSDNGRGVSKENLEGMTAKYHTSKIREFDDLLGVETFGFRGEALSSLCALTNMTIITRHIDADVATKVELDSDGKITKQTPCSRSVGTTVTLSQLFAPLPVRRRDFIKNIKKEFTKMCHMLQAYCLVSKGVRIICTNHTAKTGKTVVMQSHGNDNILANITSVFGARQSGELLTLKAAFEAGDTTVTPESIQADLETSTGGSGDLTEITNEDLEHLKAGQFSIEGFISSCSHGAGRSSKDRQYFFVNSRPCDPRNISKVVNDIYHRYNSQQYPFIYLNVLTARSDVDVNLTPDKRQLLVHNEKLLLLLIKKSLINTFGIVPSQYKMQNTSIASVFKIEPKTEPICYNDDAGTETQKSMYDNDETLLPISTSQKFLDVLSQWRRTGNTSGPAPPILATNSKRKCTNEIETRTLKMQKIQTYLSQELPNNGEKNLFSSYASDPESDSEENKSTSFNESLPNIEKLNKASKEYDLFCKAPTVERIDCKVANPAKPFLTFLNVKKTLKHDTDNESLPNTQDSQMSSASNQTEETNLTLTQASNDSDFDENFVNSEASIAKTIQLDDSETEEISLMETYSYTTIKTSLANITANLKAEESALNEMNTQTKLQRLRFKSTISPNENQNAETELQTEISKKDFARMDIIGQFNLGFIIVKLDNDLFIVDQHATDEKYNFETLQQTTTLQSQPMAVPQRLDLTIVNEMVLMDHIHVFEKNGFKFDIDQNAPPMRKVRLLCKPFSKNWEFGKEDIDELIFMLQDAPEGTICRPSRIRAMFASRACRKSVMIGKALNRATMTALIRHMGEIEQPWNCPHGRPTCRHLINIAMLTGDDMKNDSDKSGT